MNKSKKDIIIGFFISTIIIIFTFFTFFTSNTNFLQVIGSYIDDNLLYKNFYSSWIHNNEVVIVKIDDYTLNTLQQGDLRMLSFSKKIYADFIERAFDNYNASVIGIDVIFSNKSLFGEKDEKLLEDILNKYREKIVLSTRGDQKNVPLCRYADVQHGASEWIIENRIRKFKVFHDDYNIKNLCESNNIYDGNKGGILGFPISVYKTYLTNLQKEAHSLSEKKSADESLNYLKKSLDKQIEYNDGNIFSRFFKNENINIGTKGFKSYSLIDILRKNKVDSYGNKIDLDGKIVLLGEVGTLLHDRHFSPINFDEKISGIEFHANAVLTMMSEEYLYSIEKDYILIVLIITIISLFFIITKAKTYIGIISLFVLFLIHLEIGFELFSRGYIYPIFFFIYSLLVGFIVIYLYKYITIDKQKGYIKKAFSMFLSPEMVEIISNDPSKLNLKGEKGYLTMFFSDIENFTGISEKNSANSLFDFLNEYFEAMTEILTKNKGTLDKYIGDSVMGFFNAPLKISNHEYLACKTAIEQQIVLKKLNKKGSINFKIRIGINSGEVIHGNLGSKDNRINYTVIGDNVNLASRLEGINKVYGTSIIISESTYKVVKDDFITRKLDAVKVKGKNKKTIIYELIGFKGDEYNKTTITNYETALGYYFEGEYEKAINLLEKNKNDQTSKIMISRCKDIIDGKLTTINGVYVMNNK